MKKFLLALVLALIILGHEIIKLSNSKDPFNNENLVMLGLTLVIVIGVPTVVWIEWNRKKQGRPMVDEMTKKIALKSYATSYYLSFISWAIVLYASEIYKFNNRTFFIIGTLSMCLIGLIIWLYYKIRGVKDV